MSCSLVTIAVVPRERFSYSVRSLENIYAQTSHPFDLVYVDGGSPRAVRDQLRNQADRRGFRLLRTEGYLTPNQARNMALPHATGRYVVFIDNDVLVEPGWLDELVTCAEDTGASIVGPVYLSGPPGTRKIHMAAGIAHFEQQHGCRVLRVKHTLAGRELNAVADQLQRRPCELVEFHCMLVRRTVFDDLGPLDENLMSALEHEDLCLTVRERGGAVYFEPAARVTYVPPPPLALSDYPFFMLRWSEAWNSPTLRHFQEKWQLQPDDHDLAVLADWLRRHRQLTVPLMWNALHAVIGWRRANTMERALNRIAVRLTNRRHAPSGLAH